MSWTYSTDELAAILGVDAPPLRASFSSVSTDTRSIQKGMLFVALKGEKFDGNDYLEKAFEAGAAAAIGTRSSSSGPVLVVKSPLDALQRFAGEHRNRMHARIVAITGSAGKTTSKDFTAAILSTRFHTLKTTGNLNNEIGCPLSLLRMQPDTQFAVIEMGANHVGEIARLCAIARPDESAIVNIAPAHLEGFGSIDGVAKAKGEIMEGLGPDGIFYANMDDPRCAAIGSRYQGKVIRYGSGNTQALDVRLRSCVPGDDGLMQLDIDPVGVLRLPLLARAHASNVLLAISIGLQHGISEFESPIREVLAASPRIKLRRIGPIEVLDDTYNANPASMRAAVDALRDRPGRAKICVLGDMLELGVDAPALHSEIGLYAARAGINRLYSRGSHACDTIAGARGGGMPHAEVIEDHAAMAAAIAESVSPGDVVLVKGSRGMKMEAVLAALEKIYGAQPEIRT